MTLLSVITLLAVPLGLYANHLQKLRRQEAAFKQITAKGGTVFHSTESTFVDFSVRSKRIGLGCYRSNERVLCPNYSVEPEFSDSDVNVLNDVLVLQNVDFTGSKVSRLAAFGFRETHLKCSIGYDSVAYNPISLRSSSPNFPSP